MIPHSRRCALPTRATAEPTWGELHAACILEQARRAADLRRVIAEHTEEKEQLIREYEQLADRFNAIRAELNHWRAWAAAMPKKGAADAPR